MRTNMSVSIHNKFEVEVRDAKTNELKQTAVAYNIVLNGMYTDLLAKVNFFTAIHIGTGTGSLNATRTALFTPLGSKGVVNVENAMSDNVSHNKKKIVLAPEDYVGATITEVGCYGARLVTHALLEDSEGNQISITKTALDVVTIYATIFSTISASQTGCSIIGLPTTNKLLRYLCGLDTTFSTQYFAFGPSDEASTAYTTGVLGTGLTKAVAFSVIDAVANKMSTPTTRYAITDGKGHLAEFALQGIMRVVLPEATLRPPMTYTDVPIGTGDGLVDTYTLPSNNIDNTTVEVKIDGSTVDPSDYILEPARAINFTSSQITNDGGVYTDFNATPNGNRYYVIEGGGYLGYGPLNPMGLQSMTKKALAGDLGINLGFVANYPYPGYFSIACSDTLFAAAVSTTPYIKLFSSDGSTGALTELSGKFNIIPSKTCGKVAFSPDGVHLAVCEITGKVIIYKWNDSSFTKLTAPAGQVDITPSLTTAFRYFGDYLVIGSTVAPKLSVYKRVGDEYTVCTIVNGQTNELTMISIEGDRLLAGLKTYTGLQVYTISDTTITYSSTISITIGYGGATFIDANILALHGSANMSLYHWDRNATLTLLSTGPSPDINGSIMQLVIRTTDSVYAAFHRGFAWFDIKARTTKLIFDTEPAEGEVITATYDVNGIHKTDQYVIDVGASITFGGV